MKAHAADVVILALGVAAVSTAALLIREADAPSLVVSAYRLSLASLPLLAYGAVQRFDARPAPRQRGGTALLTLVSGVSLALHIAFWVAAVQQTSIVTSVVLVTTQPLWVALVSGPLLGEPPSRRTWFGIALAGGGALVMVGNDLGAGGDTIRGDLFALVGAVLAAVYFIAGRHVRRSGQDWLPYVTSSYSTAAVILLVATVLAGEALTGYSPRTYLFMALLALVPQLLGHTALNRSLGYLPAATVAIAVLGEPVGASILGVIFLDETPNLLQLGGGGLVLLGVYFGLSSTLKRDAVAPEAT